jgi:L-ascorbate metabolism protein UlaG (beta-lactamase superfamily)
MARALLTVGRLHRLAFLVLALFLGSAPAFAAGCLPVVARSAVPLPASWRLAEASGVGLTFLGHASFLVESPGGVTIVTDYNGVIRPDFLPDVVTMNHAHPTHYTDTPDPGIKLVLRGWNTGEGVPHYDVDFGDVRIRNVPTNIRRYGGTEFAGNSIFLFETGGLCIAHLSHLHHTLTPAHLAALGQVDVLLAPVDGAYTLSQDDMITVIEQIKPALVVPMHYFGPDVLGRFLDRIGNHYPVERSDSPHVVLSRATLPNRTTILVLPGG